MERRLKLVPVPPSWVLNAFKETTPATVPRIRGLPDGFEIVSVEYCWIRQAFLFLVRHESFEVVPYYGAEIPIWNGAVEFVTYDVITPEERLPW